MFKSIIIRSSASFAVALTFLINSFSCSNTFAWEMSLPVPGVMVHLSPPLDPPILKGIKVHPDNPFKFDFILDLGDKSLSPSGGDENSRHPQRSEGSQQEQLKTEATKLIKYFLASLTIPEKDLWVNLSPYEKTRIIPHSFGLTEMGRDLLAEDYMLKQITASLIYPEDRIGKKFWKRIYEEAVKKFGTTNIPVNTFNKVWIVPEKAVVYENTKAGTAYIVESRLKVMLEQDYLSLEKHTGGVIPAKAGIQNNNDINALGSNIVREIVIPELTREVNEDKNFAQLRQVYNSLILAAWYKKKIRDSILEQVYADKNKIQGLVIPANAGIQNKNNVEYIYQRYLQAFKKGVYNYIKEDIDPATQETVPRKYFSGGCVLFGMANKIDKVGDRSMLGFLRIRKRLGTVSSRDEIVSAGIEPDVPIETNLAVAPQPMVQEDNKKEYGKELMSHLEKFGLIYENGKWKYVHEKNVHKDVWTPTTAESMDTSKLPQEVEALDVTPMENMPRIKIKSMVFYVESRQALFLAMADIDGQEQPVLVKRYMIGDTPHFYVMEYFSGDPITDTQITELGVQSPLREERKQIGKFLVRAGFTPPLEYIHVKDPTKTGHMSHKLCPVDAAEIFPDYVEVHPEEPQLADLLQRLFYDRFGIKFYYGLADLSPEAMEVADKAMEAAGVIYDQPNSQSITQRIRAAAKTAEAFVLERNGNLESLKAVEPIENSTGNEMHVYEIIPGKQGEPSINVIKRRFRALDAFKATKALLESNRPGLIPISFLPGDQEYYYELDLRPFGYKTLDSLVADHGKLGKQFGSQFLESNRLKIIKAVENTFRFDSSQWFLHNDLRARSIWLRMDDYGEVEDIKFDNSERLSVVKSDDMTLTGTQVHNIPYEWWDFRGQDFSRLNLSNMVFWGCDFSGSKFVETELEGATLSWSNFEGVDFTDANLTNVVFFRANVRGANFQGIRAHLVMLKSAHRILEALPVVPKKIDMLGVDEERDLVVSQIINKTFLGLREDPDQRVKVAGDRSMVGHDNHGADQAMDAVVGPGMHNPSVVIYNRSDSQSNTHLPEIDFHQDQIPFTKSSLARALFYHALERWDNKTVFEDTLRRSDHKVLLFSGMVAGGVCIGAGYGIGHAIVDQLSQGILPPLSWIITSILGWSFGGFMPIISLYHRKEALYANMVYKNTLRFLDGQSKASVDDKLIRLARKFFDETGWEVRWSDDPLMLAYADRQKKQLILSIGWVVKSKDVKDDRRLAYLSDILTRIRHGIKLADQAMDAIAEELSKKMRIKSNSSKASNRLEGKGSLVSVKDALEGLSSQEQEEFYTQVYKIGHTGPWDAEAVDQVRERVREKALEKDGEWYVFVTGTGLIVGQMLIVSPRKYLPYTLSNIETLSGFQGQGIGSKMVEFFINTGAQRGINQAAIPAELRAIPFYEKIFDRSRGRIRPTILPKPYAEAPYEKTYLINIAPFKKKPLDFAELAQISRIPNHLNAISALIRTANDSVQITRSGGIDLTHANDFLQTKVDSRFRGNDSSRCGNNRKDNNYECTDEGDKGIEFHLSPALLAQLQNAPGFVPVIISIRPMTDLKVFLGLVDNAA